jgi:hypothetical protein
MIKNLYHIEKYNNEKKDWEIKSTHNNLEEAEAEVEATIRIVTETKKQMEEK